MLATVGGLDELHVHLHPVPVLIRHVQVPRLGWAGREALGDAVAEGRVREVVHGQDAHRRRRDERREALAIVGGVAHVDRRRRFLGESGEGHVENAGRIDGRIDIRIGRAGLRRRGHRHCLGKGLTAVARDRDPDLGVVALEDGPHRVDVVLVGVPDHVVDGDPLLVLDVAKLLGARVREVLQRLAAVADDPVLPHVVGVRHLDGAVGMQVRPAPESVEGEHRLVDPALGIPGSIRVGCVGP